ncbi:HdeD family acid-resistance protein [Brachyspira pilosicoli]|uniref:HdeD family acid-resistance protein n=1 Tax=Brachyspira pilosicoli TaxID=52584 RepID=UPI0030046746
MGKLARVLWLIFGILLIISGVATMFNPVETVLVLAYIIGFLTIFSGISAIFYFFSLRHLANSTLILIDGIISTICGIIIISNLTISGAFIPYMVSFFVIVRGVVAISSSLELKREGYTKWGLSLFSGLLTLLAGIILAFNPILGAVYVSVILGLGLILYGIVTLQLWFAYGDFFKS